ncbi:hypothetical protein BCR44DRAFT_1429501 [Catenaria anguillulae PL171]|uniref:Uncharacterized protein n=1 Tax=Catenaria anguillulae PL171 TaxID=765915 RepID=A0A1Y2HTY1_9FUNG|nr:hypothetical protein BCR44DRAFT_1429501 [Catenaria anguillulae PL171]
MVPTPDQHPSPLAYTDSTLQSVPLGQERRPRVTQTQNPPTLAVARAVLVPPPASREISSRRNKGTLFLRLRRCSPHCHAFHSVVHQESLIQTRAIEQQSMQMPSPMTKRQSVCFPQPSLTWTLTWPWLPSQSLPRSCPRRFQTSWTLIQTANVPAAAWPTRPF